MKQILFLFFLLLAAAAGAQHYRGLSVVNDRTVWMSGSKGQVVRTTDGGKSWDTLNPSGFESRDFRDIHAWDKNNALVMSSGDSARILKTKNGGKTWTVVHASDRPGVFLDALDMKGKSGVVIGDPYPDHSGNYFFEVLLTADGGTSWQPFQAIRAEKDAALFAASGSNIMAGDPIGGLQAPEFTFIYSSGTASYLVSIASGHEKRWLLPLRAGTASGAYSFCQAKTGYVVVGGNYLLPDDTDSTVVTCDMASGLVKAATGPPGGYRSCVAATPGRSILVTTGTSGTDYSTDNGNSWTPATWGGYNVCAFSGSYLWLAGNKGTWKKVPVKEILLRP